MKIIFKQGENLVILHPTDEALSFMTIKEIADKDVPTGVPYKIIEDSELPTDRTFRAAWTADDSIFTDGVGK